MLIVFAGLPASGKSTLSRALAQARRAAWLRIDAIEQALRNSGTLAGDVGPAGYLAAYALAEANLRLGLDVVADCVNPIAITRAAWRDVAARAGVPIVEVEVVCSDTAEHRRRVEHRPDDIPGLPRPSWEEVRARRYQPWDRPPVVIDTAGRTAAAALGELSARIPAPRPV